MDIEKERQAFEQWGKTQHCIFEQYQGIYVDDETQNCWAGWLARSKLETTRAALSFDAAWDGIDWDKWRMEPIRELVRHLHSLTTSHAALPECGHADTIPVKRIDRRRASICQACGAELIG